MKVVRTIREMRSLAERWRRSGMRVGCVPTMGALHEGHRTLICASVRECDRTVVTLFVNPLQFRPQEDLARYPRTFRRDLDLCRSAGVNVLFAPSAAEMYPDGSGTRVVPPAGLTSRYEGQARPGHFTGVATVVLKLFQATDPHAVYFGRKDAQQCAVVGRMIRDLDLGLTLRVLPTVREADGLAMSSRNRYLSNKERETAAVLSRALRTVRTLIRAGERDRSRLLTAGRAIVRREPGARLEYLDAVHPETFLPAKRIRGRVLFTMAVRVGSVRLLDNLSMEV